MQKEILKMDVGEQPQMFKGMLMGIQPLHCGFHLFKDKKSYIFISGNSILLAFEDSTICVFDLHTKQVLDAVKIHSLKIKIL